MAAALAEELALLSGEARRMLEGAAVAGDPFEPELMAAAAGVDTAAAVAALDELCAAISSAPQTCRAAFASGTRSSAARSTKPRPAAGVSGRISEAPRRWPRAARRRRHARTTSSAPPRQGDEDAVAVLREAGEEAAQRTPAGAARWFAAALRLLGDSAPAEERVELLTALAGARGGDRPFRRGARRAARGASSCCRTIPARASP